jgi:precorrin-2 dehydrogenase
MTARGYPVTLTNLAKVRCVVVGGGRVAEHKVGDLLAGGARPAVISPTLTEALGGWQPGGSSTLRGSIRRAT